jgi:sugar/nucleoside kinase (ribokinase family)
MKRAMRAQPDILCIGSVLWDVIGHCPGALGPGQDVPGRITRRPGGVALNIARTLRRFGLAPALLTAIGRDGEGEELIAACEALGLLTHHAYRPETLPTDRYMAIEGANGLVAAIADAHSLEASGAAILAPLTDGRLGSAAAPWEGPVALDGNLAEALLAEIAASPLFAKADLRIAPASPGKALRLRPFLGHESAVFYVNLEEAALLAGARQAGSADAARALRAKGAARALVTDGPRPAAFAEGAAVYEALPPAVHVRHVTGAGDTVMAAHIAAEGRGLSGEAALRAALDAAAAYISGDAP